MNFRTIASVLICAGAVIAAAPLPAAHADRFSDGAAAVSRRDYTTAAKILGPMAERGDARAQTYLGFLYAHGNGVPQSYPESAVWYRRAAEQGNATAQYMLGLMYDKAQGVPLSYIEAHKWLDLAVAGATERERRYWLRIRDAVASKLSVAERAEAQRRALEWRAVRETVH